MIKTSKHNITNITNKSKLKSLDSLLLYYKHDLMLYINYIIDGTLPLNKQLSSKLLPTEIIPHSRYKQLIYKQASEIIRSQIKKANIKRYNKFKKIYTYFIKNHPESKFVNTKFSDLKLKDVYKSKYFTIPNLNNISINFDERFFNIKEGKYFDNYIKITLPFFNEKGTRALTINIPLKQHKHSNNLRLSGYKLKNNIQLKRVNGMYTISLVWFKEDIKPKEVGTSLGIDMGYKKLIVTSDNQFYGTELLEIYERISKKKQGSKNFKQLLIHRDNLINYAVNQIDLSEVKTLVIEDLKDVKKKSKGKIHNKIMNKIQRWSYPKTETKLDSICKEYGIKLVKVSPTYTSVTCSKCGFVDKKSRNGEDFVCTNCGYEIDADLNASINIHNRGVYSPSS